MLILPQEVEVTCRPVNKKHLESKGYKWEYNKIIKISVLDMSPKSNLFIKINCDYCGKEIGKIYSNYIAQNKNGIIHKDCCEECSYLKIKESNLLKYNVESICSLDQTKNKKIQTNLLKYGSITPLNNEQGKEKRKETMVKKYGCEHPMQNKKIRENTINTFINKFGVSNPMQNEKIKNKQHKSMYLNDTAPKSKQQLYLHILLGGELNYPFGRCLLDIAFPNEMIYIEYDGGGHNLSVKYKTQSQEEFDYSQLKRYLYLKSKKWKQIKIISLYDYLPSDEIILQEIGKAKKWFESDDYSHWHYEINIGNLINDKNFGKLRRIKDKDILIKEVGNSTSFLFNEKECD